MKTIEEVVADLLPIAKQRIVTDSESFDAYDLYCGQSYDTFDAGVWCGEVMQARSILERIGVKFEINEEFGE